MRQRVFPTKQESREPVFVSPAPLTVGEFTSVISVPLRDESSAPILQMGKLRLRKTDLVVLGHR